MRLKTIAKQVFQIGLSCPKGPFKRIYCDPSVGYLGFANSRLRREAIKSFVQLAFVEEEILRRIWSPSALESDRNLDVDLLEQIANYSIAVALETRMDELPEMRAAHKPIFEEYILAARNAMLLLAHELDKYKPDAVLYAQGYGILAFTLRILCAERGLPMLAIENTAIKDRMLWDVISGVTVNQNMAKNFFWRYQNIVSSTAAATFCETIRTSTKNQKQIEHTSPSNRWISPSARPYILFLGQVYTDSSLLFGSHPGFGPEEILQTLFIWAEARNLDVFVKLHPKEASGVAPVTHRPYNRLTYRKLSSNQRTASFLKREFVTIDEDNTWDTYSLIDGAEIVVTINSQAGLEAAIRNRKVVTCGKSFYGGLGFTFDTASSPQLASTLSEILQLPLSQEALVLAQIFFYIFFNKYCREKSDSSLIRLMKDQAKWAFPF